MSTASWSIPSETGIPTLDPGSSTMVDAVNRLVGSCGAGSPATQA